MMKSYLSASLLGFLLFVCSHTYGEPNTVVASIPVGVNPAGMAITPDSRTAYLANVNNYGIFNEHAVTVINLRTNLVLTTIRDPSFNEVYTVTLNADATKAYVTNSNGSTLSVIDTATNRVIRVIPGFDGPSGMVIDHKRNIGYVNNYGGPDGLGSGNGRTVTLVDVRSDTVIGTIQVDKGPVALAISPNNKFVYVINYVDGTPGSGTLNIIQTNINQVVASVGGFFGPFGIAVTPNGKFAYITNFGSNDFDPIGTTVSAVNLRKRKIIATIDVGLQPAGVGISKNGRFAYITNYNTLYSKPNFVGLTAGEGTVEIIDIATNTVIPPTIAVGSSPARVAISPNGKFAYISNFIANTIDVIALPRAARKKSHDVGCDLCEAEK